jgi:Fe-S-cluster containining protein
MPTDTVIPILPERENMDAFNARMRPHAGEYHRRINEIVSSKRGARVRLLQLRALLDDVTSHVQTNTPCRRGCAHCCHIPVVIHEHEAGLIGDEIGRMPERPKKYWRRGDLQKFETSYSNPCAFLGDENECTIYEHRPIACRKHISMAADDALCRLDEIRDGVPYLNLFMFDQAAALICADERVAELRQFFPRSAA